MAGDADRDRELSAAGVSIHARAWRATAVQEELAVGIVVSIHARAWRATLLSKVRQNRPVVSIHARAWRATNHDVVLCVSSSGFNSRPRMAGDEICNDGT